MTLNLLPFLFFSFVMSASTTERTFGLNMNFKRARDTQNIILKKIRSEINAVLLNFTEMAQIDTMRHQPISKWRKLIKPRDLVFKFIESNLSACPNFE